MTPEPWMLTASGKEFDLVTPTPEMVDFGDIAEHLSKIARFAGATPGHFYSVAEHCVRAADDLYARGLPLEVCAYALLHDAHEAYIVDRITPERWAEEAIAREHFHDEAIVSAVIQVPKLLRYRIDQAVHTAAGLAFPMPSAAQTVVKHIDLVMLATEKRDLMRPGRSWALLDGVEPLADRIAPRSWPFACQHYLVALRRYAPEAKFSSYLLPGRGA